MPFTATELQQAGKSAIDFYVKNKPVDSYNTDRPFLRWLVGAKKPFPGGLQYVVEQIRKSNDNNGQWFYGDQQVTYNKKNTLNQASYEWRSIHDGFSLNEDQLLQNGIVIADGPPGRNSEAERSRLTDLLKENIETLSLGFDEKLDYDLHAAAASTDTINGLDGLLSSTSNTTGTVGGIDRATDTYWRHNLKTGMAAATMIQDMEIQWRACSRNGGQPDGIFMGSDFLDAFRTASKTDISRTVMNPAGDAKGNARLDASVTYMSFHGVPVMWDPVFLDLQTGGAGANFEKRCYFLNSKHLTYRPAQGHEKIARNPPRVYDRYAYYWGLTTKCSLTLNRSNAHSVMVLA